MLSISDHLQSASHCITCISYVCNPSRTLHRVIGCTMLQVKNRKQHVINLPAKEHPACKWQTLFTKKVKLRLFPE